MRVIGFLRGGDIILVRRQREGFAVDRRRFEQLVFADIGRMDVELGDQVADCPDAAFRHLVVPIDMQERMELERRNDVAAGIETREIGTEPKRREHAWR